MSNILESPTIAQINVAKRVLATLRKANLVKTKINKEEYRTEYVNGDFDPVKDHEEICISFEGDEHIGVEDLFNAKILEGNKFECKGRICEVFEETIQPVDIVKA